MPFRLQKLVVCFYRTHGYSGLKASHEKMRWFQGHQRYVGAGAVAEGGSRAGKSVVVQTRWHQDQQTWGDANKRSLQFEEACSGDKLSCPGCLLQLANTLGASIEPTVYKPTNLPCSLIYRSFLSTLLEI